METGIRKLSEKELKDLGYEGWTFEAHVHWDRLGGRDKFSRGVPETSIMHKVMIEGEAYTVLSRVDDRTQNHDGDKQNAVTYYLMPVEEQDLSEFSE